MSPRIAIALFAVALVVRLPFQTETLWAHDSILYERAIAAFAPQDQSPQPPGYLWYVLLLRALVWVTGDANRAMTLVAVVAAAAAIALLYVLGARMFDERTGRAGALLLLTAVTFWGESAVAYPYTLLAALSIAGALLFWRVLEHAHAGRRTVGALLLASAFWGIAVGLRTDVTLFLAPLWLMAALAAGWGAALAGAAVAAILAAVWFGASAALAGGLQPFATALFTQGEGVGETSSILGPRGLAALPHNGYELARFLGRALYFIAPLAAAPLFSPTERRLQLRDRQRLVFLALWTLTPLAIYVPIHVGEYGYVFSMLPGLALLGARGAVALGRTLRARHALAAIVGAATLANAAIFLYSDSPLSAAWLAREDASHVEKPFALDRLGLRDAVVVTAYEALIIDRYARVPDLVAFTPSDTAVEERVSAAEVVVWDDVLRVRGPGWQDVRMRSGSHLRIARNTRGAILRFYRATVTLER